MKPDYRLVANDRDITDLIRAHFVNLSVSDSAGIESDTLDITLSDVGVIHWPGKGAKLDFWLGYTGRLAYKGQFYVDELDHNGPPDQIVIHAKATDMRRLSSIRKSRDWSGQTIQQIIATMATEQGLIPAVSAVFQPLSRDNLVQLNESDLHFLSRLARDVDAVAKAKAGRLLFVEQGVARTAGGHEMPLITVDRQDCAGHGYQERGRNEYARVAAGYYEWVTYTSRWYYYGTRTYRRRKYSRVYVGASRGRTKYVAGYFESKEAATRAAQAEFNRMGREESTLSIELAQGNPGLMAEMRLKVSGFRNRISELDWIVADVSHTLDSSGGLSSSLNAVRPAAYKTDS